MAFAIDPTDSIGEELQRLVQRRLRKALQALDEIGDDPSVLPGRVHEVRKRTKEVRALARLVRTDLDADQRAVDRTVRDAARTLGPLRDAHALLGAVDDLADHAGEREHWRFARLRLPFADAAAAASTTDETAARLATARLLLDDAVEQVAGWHLDDGFDAVETGLRTTYRRGRRALALARSEPTDEHVHEWRKAAKQLWYDLRALSGIAPSVVGPMIGSLDDLAELLGDDHDLAVIGERLRTDPELHGGDDVVDRVLDIARTRQQSLRDRAFRLGGTVYAEKPRTFAERLRALWSVTAVLGPESEVAPGDGANTGRVGDLSPSVTPALPVEHVERERKFVIASTPPLPDRGDDLRQGYLALDGDVAVRVRDVAGTRFVLTIKAGEGATRTEVERTLTADQFAALWPHTVGRRVDKTRFLVPHGPHVVEIDVFHGIHDGLVVAEVEFADDEALRSFVAPAWFGVEVTDDPAYSNARLAVSQRLPTPG